LTTHAVLEPALIDDGWEPIRPGAFVNLIGPFYQRIVDGRAQFCFRVQPKHDNTTGRPHGGLLMSFLDEALGLAAHIARSDGAFFTAGFDCQFVSASRPGDLIVAETQVVGSTKSLMFMRGECKVGERTIASANGIWKKVSDTRPW
jgi:acyl-coenzyme A thioesterase PaaI-like protein